MKKLLYLLSFSVVVASDTVNINDLQWQDTKDNQSINVDWKEAKNYCDKLSLLGHKNWRLPNIKELQSIIDNEKYDPAIKKEFKNLNTNYGFYWSHSLNIVDAKNIWVVNFETGKSYSVNRTTKGYIRCVRDRQ